MGKTISYLRVLFHILTLFLIILSLYPGSILGFIFYGNFQSQPQLTEDFLNISSNHFYTYAIISLLGFFAYLGDKKFKLVVIYLFLLSFILEILHLVIPERSFQISDLIGNVLGVTAIYILVMIYKFWRQ